jgi:multidrug resistance efflux pump
VEAPLLDVVSVAGGYGPVQPARLWTAVSKVAGRVVEIHPRLRDEEILSEGTVLLRIDPVDYDLALAQSRAEMAELDVQKQNGRASLDIEQRNLELARRQMERIRKPVKQGTTS